jgi:hypothetical protein
MAYFFGWLLRYMSSPGQKIGFQLQLLKNPGQANDKGRIFMDANKRTIILNTKLHLGFGFPCKPGTSKFQRLNDVRNNEKMKVKMMNPVKSVKNTSNPNPVL